VRHRAARCEQLTGRDAALQRMFRHDFMKPADALRYACRNLASRGAKSRCGRFV